MNQTPNRNSLRLLPALALLTLFSACGFQLKGYNSNAQTLPAVHLECDCDAALENTLISAFTRREIPSHSTSEPNLTVSISDAKEHTFNTAVGDHDQSKEVELTLSFHAQLTQNGTFLGQRRIESSAYIRYNSDTYLGSSSEAAETHARLQRENADKLIRYITSVNPE